MSNINLTQYELHTANQEVKKWVNKNLVKYLENNPENEQEIYHLLDYLNQYDKPENIEKFNYEKVKIKTEKWNALLIEKGLKAIETENDIEHVLDLGNDLSLVKLIGKSAFDREGSLMSHCVSSYHGKSNVTIYSIRDKYNKPHCTIEVYNGKSINQIKGKGNGSIHPKYIDAVIKTLKHFDMKIGTSDMELLGYMRLDNTMLGRLKDRFGDIAYISILKDSYIYLGDKAYV